MWQVSPLSVYVMLMNRPMCSTERMLLIPQDRQDEVDRSHHRAGLRWNASRQWIFFWDNIQRHALWLWLFPIASITFLGFTKHDYEPTQSSVIRCAPSSHERIS
jgi:hypothetical protein